MEKVFLVFNTACFGDVLLCNTLCQNIKMIYPDSKVVFVADKPFAKAAEFQKDVDEVVIYDKRGVHKGFGGMLKFIKEFPYKKPYCAFLTYWNVRNYMISLALGTKKIVSENKKNPEPSAQKQHADLLAKITDADIKNFPIRYLPQDADLEISDFSRTIAFCPVSKDISKDMPYETAVNLLGILNDEGFNVVFCGAGHKSVEYSQKLKDLGCEFTDLTNKTTIPELAYVLNKSKALVSVDTGTMHLGCAVNTKTVVVFYKPEMTAKWAPNPEVYPNTILIKNNQSAENISYSLMRLLEEKNV